MRTLETLLTKLDTLALEWWAWIVPHAADVLILAAVVWLVDVLARKRSAVWRAALWTIVLLKVLLPVRIDSPVSVVGWLQSDVEQALRAVQPPLQESPPQTEAEPVSPPRESTLDAPREERPVALLSTQETSVGRGDSAQPRALANAVAAPSAPREERPVEESAVAATMQTVTHPPLWLFLPWLGVVSTLLTICALRTWRLRELIGRAKPCTNAALRKAYVEIAGRLRLRRIPELVVGEGIGAPLVYGVWRPKVVLPSTVAESMPLHELRPVLAHELGHVRRMDPLVNWLQVLCRLFFFWHPGFWLADLRIRKYREEACDDVALAVMDGERRAYAQGILHVLELGYASPVSVLTLLGSSEERRGLESRLRRIMQPRRLATRLSLVGTLAVFVIAAVVLPGGRENAKESAGEPRTIPELRLAGVFQAEAMPVEDVLEALEERTGIQVRFEGDLSDYVLTFRLVDSTLSDFLESVLPANDLYYDTRDGAFVVFPVGDFFKTYRDVRLQAHRTNMPDWDAIKEGKIKTYGGKLKDALQEWDPSGTARFMARYRFYIGPEHRQRDIGPYVLEDFSMRDRLETFLKPLGLEYFIQDNFCVIERPERLAVLLTAMEHIDRVGPGSADAPSVRNILDKAVPESSEVSVAEFPEVMARLSEASGLSFVLEEGEYPRFAFSAGGISVGEFLDNVLAAYWLDYEIRNSICTVFPYERPGRRAFGPGMASNALREKIPSDVVAPGTKLSVILQAIQRESDFSFALDPEMDKPVTFASKDPTVDELLESLLPSNGLNGYTYKNDVIRVFPWSEAQAQSKIHSMVPGAPRDRISGDFKASGTQLSEVLRSLEKRYGLTFALDPGVDQPVTFTLQNPTVFEALDAALSRVGLHYVPLRSGFVRICSKSVISPAGSLKPTATPVEEVEEFWEEDETGSARPEIETSASIPIRAVIPVSAKETPAVMSQKTVALPRGFAALGLNEDSGLEEYRVSIPGLPGNVKPLEMVSIPAGTFMMGSPDDEFLRSESHDWNRHRVTLSRAFYLGKYELTRAQWEAVMGKKAYSSRRDPETPPDNPVVWVDWVKCAEFCNRLSEAMAYTPAYDEKTWFLKPDANGFRMPTEAEWEYACRAGTQTAYSFGDYPPHEITTAKPGSWERVDKWMRSEMAKPNPWGLLAMHRGVFEYCSDRWERPNDRGPQVDPRGPEGPNVGYACVLRSASDPHSGRRDRSAARYGHRLTRGMFDIGFRLAMTRAAGEPVEKLARESETGTARPPVQKTGSVLQRRIPGVFRAAVDPPRTVLDWVSEATDFKYTLKEEPESCYLSFRLHEPTVEDVLEYVLPAYDLYYEMQDGTCTIFPVEELSKKHRQARLDWPHGDPAEWHARREGTIGARGSSLMDVFPDVTDMTDPTRTVNFRFYVGPDLRDRKIVRDPPTNGSMRERLMTVVRTLGLEYFIHENFCIIERPGRLVALKSAVERIAREEREALSNPEIEATLDTVILGPLVGTRKTSLREIMERVAEVSGLPFVLEKDVFPRLDFSVKDVTVREFLGTILRSYGLYYSIQNGVCTIYTTSVPPEPVAASDATVSEAGASEAGAAAPRAESAAEIPEALGKTIPGMFQMQQTNLSEVLERVASETGLAYVLEEDADKLVTFALVNPTVEGFLRTVLPGAGLGYVVLPDDTVRITPVLGISRIGPERGRSGATVPEAFRAIIPGNLVATGTKLSAILEIVREATGLAYVLGDEVDKPVTFATRNPTVGDLLDAVLPVYDLDYVLLKNDVVHIYRPTPDNRPRRSQFPRRSAVPEALKKTIPGDLEVNRTRLSVILTIIEDETGVPFVLDAGSDKPLTFALKDPVAADLLDAVLPTNGLDYTVLKSGAIRVGPESVIRSLKPAQEERSRAVPEALRRVIPGDIVASGTNLSIILQIIREETGLSFVLDKGADKPVTFAFKDPKVVDLLDAVLPANGLDYVVLESGVIRVGEARVIESLRPAGEDGARAVQEALRKIIPGDVVASGTRLSIIVQIVQEDCGLSFVLDEGADTPVTFAFKNPKVVDLLEAVLPGAGLDYVVLESGAIRVGSKGRIGLLKLRGLERSRAVPEALRKTIPGDVVASGTNLSVILQIVQEDCGLSFVLDEGADTPVTFAFKNPKVVDLLEAVLPGVGLYYTVLENGTVRVGPEEAIGLLKLAEAEPPTALPVETATAVPEVLRKTIAGDVVTSGTNLRILLLIIQEETGCSFALDAGANRPVTVALKDPTVAQLLDTVLPTVGLDYVVLEGGAIRVGSEDDLRALKLVWAETPTAVPVEAGE